MAFYKNPLQRIFTRAFHEKQESQAMTHHPWLAKAICFEQTEPTPFNYALAPGHCADGIH